MKEKSEPGRSGDPAGATLACADCGAMKTDAVESLKRGFYEGNPERLKSLEETRANEEIARKIQVLRRNSGLMQAELAKVCGTRASVIFRLEDSD